ncbi:Conserved_hypothetical protein [Hexamita inflata]|uniref:Uncharacterized protein n=1 Tax=Hexamita inflata TaxID=28002 RepID=A0AA86P9R8_9EUKA|nr:Conserved hypothetical protein [Hexamita inflata]
MSALEDARRFYELDVKNMNMTFQAVPVLVFDRVGHLLQVNFNTRRAKVRLFGKSMPKPSFSTIENTHDYEDVDVTLNSVNVMAPIMKNIAIKCEQKQIEHPMISKMIAQFPEFKKEITDIAQIPQLGIIDFTSFGSRKYIPMLKFAHKIRTPCQSSYESSRNSIIKTTIATPIFVQALQRILATTRQIIGGFLSKFADKQDLSQMIFKVCQELSSMVQFSQTLNKQLVLDKIGVTQKNAELIVEKMSVNQVNVSNIDYNVLMMLLIKIQLIPLYIIVFADRFQDTLKGKIEIMPNCHQIVKNICSNVWHDMIQRQMVDLNSYIFQLGRSVLPDTPGEQLVNDILKSNQNIVANPDILTVYFAQYIPTITFKQSTIEETQKQILQHLNQLLIIIITFGYFGDKFVDSLNFTNFQYVVKLDVFSQANFTIDSILVSQVTEFKRQNTTVPELTDFCLQLPKLIMQEDLCSTVDTKRLIQLYQGLASSLENIIDQVHNCLSFQNTEKQFRETLKLNKIYSNIRESYTVNKIPQRNLPFQKAQDMSQMIFMQMKPENFIFDFLLIQSMIDNVKLKQQVIKQVETNQFYCLFMQIDLFDTLSDFYTKGKKLQQKMGQIVKVDLVKQANYINDELQYIRELLFMCHCNPHQLQLGQQIKELLLKQCIQLQQNIESIFITNGVNFMFTFAESSDQSYIDIHYNSFTKPVLAIQQLVSEVVKIKYDLSENRKQIAEMLLIFDQFVCEKMLAIEQLFENIIKLSLDDMLLGMNSPKEFLELYPALQQQLSIQPFKITADKHVQNAFLSSIAKVTNLKIESEIVSSDQLLSKYVKQTEISRGMHSNANTKNTYANINLRLTENNFNITLLISEIKFWLIELSAIQIVLSDWRKWVLEDSSFKQVRIINANNHASSFSLLLGIIPITEIVMGKYRIEMTLTHNSNLTLGQFPTQELIEITERTANCVKNMKQRILAGKFEIMSVYHDYQKKNSLFTDKSEQMQFNKDKFIKLSIEYAGWKDYTEFVEKYIKTVQNKVISLYLIKTKTFSSSHYLAISKLLKLQVDKNQKAIVENILGQLQDSETQNNFLRLLLLIRHNAEIDQQARDQLKQIDSVMRSFYVVQVFQSNVSYKYDDTLIKQVDQKSVMDLLGYMVDARANLNSIMQVVLQPTFLQNICSDALTKISQIINNSGYMGKREIQRIESYEKHYQLIFQIIRQQLAENTFPQEFREFEQTIQQWRYTSTIEQTARDLEAIIQLIKMIDQILKKLPLLLKDLIKMYLETNIIIFSSKTFSFTVNYFNQKQQRQLFACVFYWQYIYENYLDDVNKIDLISLVTNEQFINKITFVYQRTNDLKQDIQENNVVNILKNLSTQIIKNKIDQNYISDKIIFDQQESNTPIKIIPCKFNFDRTKEMFPYSLLIQLPQFILYDKYPSANDIYGSNTFNKQFMFGLNQIVTEHRRNEIYFKYVQSGQEIIKFQRHVPAPKRNLEVLDKIYPLIKQEIQFQAFKSWDQFILAISKKQNKKQQSITTCLFSNGHEYSQYQQITSVSLSNSESNSDFSKSHTGVQGQLIADNDVFKEELVNFIHSTTYQSFCLVISTYFMQCFDKIKNDALKFQMDDDELQQVIQTFGSIIAAIVKCNKPKHFKQAARARTQEWMFAFNDLKKMTKLKDFYKRQSEIPNIAFSYLNYKTNRIEATDLQQSFTIQCGQHWQGEAKDTEAVPLTALQKAVIAPILQGISQKLVVFAMSSVHKGYANAEFKQNISYISRLLMMNVQQVFLSQNNFAEQYQKIETALICGMLCIVYGIEYISSQEVFYLANLAFNIHRQKGKLLSVCNIYDERGNEVLQKIPDVNQQRKNVVINYANIEDFQNIGSLIFFCPFLQNVETSTNIKFDNGDQIDRLYNQRYKAHIPEKTQQTQNVSFMYQTEQEIQFKTEQIIAQFENSITSLIDTISVQSSYTSLHLSFGQSFYDLNQTLLQFNSQYCVLSLQSIQNILNKVKDKTNAYQISLITYDYIIKQCLFFINDDINNLKICQTLANIVSGCFGLDLAQSTQIFNFATQTYQQIEFALSQSNIKHKNTQQFRNKIQFNKYFIDFLRDNINAQFLEQLQTFSLTHQLTQYLAYDILNVNELISTKNPMLLLSTSQYHLKMFVNYLSVLNKTKLHYITSKDEYNLIQQNQQENSILVFCPCSVKSFNEFSSKILEQSVNPQNNQVLIISVDQLMYSELCKTDFMTIIQQKYLITPSYEGSITNKKLFSSLLSINHQQYVDNAEIKLMPLWLGKQQTQDKSIQQLFINISTKQMQYIPAIEDKILKVERKAISLQQFVFGVIQVIYDTLSKIFHIGNSFEEVILWRSLTCLFLYKSNILQVSSKQYSFEHSPYNITDDIDNIQMELTINNSTFGFDAVKRSILQDYLKAKQLNKATDQAFSDILSYEREYLTTIVSSNVDLDFYSIDSMKRAEDQLNKYMKQENDVAKSYALHQQSQLQDTQQQQKTIQFIFNEDFLFQSYFSHENLDQAFQNIAVPIMSSMWNAAQLHYTTIKCAGKWKEFQNKNVQKELEIKYTKFKEILLNVQQIGLQEQIAFNSYIVLKASEQNLYPNFRTQCLKDFNIKKNKQQINDHGLTQDQQQNIIKSLFNKISQCLPEQMLENEFSYINYEGKMVVNAENDDYTHKLTFQEYKIGSGILSQIVLETDQQILEKDIEFVVNRVTESRLQQAKGIITKIDSQHLIESYDTPNKVSVQKLLNQIIYLDAHRAALVFMLSSCIISPLSTCLHAPDNHIGKSVLIQVAELFVRDIIEANQVQIQDTSSQFINSGVRQAIVDKCQLRHVNQFVNSNDLSIFNPLSKQYCLEFFQQLSQPMFHIHSSDANQKSITEDLVLLLRDHIIRLNGTNDIKIDMQQESVCGITQLQDASFIIECKSDSPLLQLAGIHIQIPPLYEVFVSKVLQTQHKHIDKEQVDSFVNGLFLLKSNISCPFLHSFDLIDKLHENKYLTLNKDAYVNVSQIIKTQSYQQNYIQNKQLQSTQDCLNYQQQSLIDLLLNCEDDKLYTLDIKSLLYVFKNHLSQKINTVLTEKLPTLANLGYLQVKDIQNSPWKDYDKILIQRQPFIPLWQSYCINHYFNQVQLIPKQQQFALKEAQIIISQSEFTYLEQNLSKSLLGCLDRQFDSEQMLTFGFSSQNGYYYAHYLQLYGINGQNYNPYLSNKVFEMFLNLEIQKELNISRLSTLIKYGQSKKNFYSLTGIYCEDEMLSSRYYLSQQSSKYSAIIYKQLFDNEITQSTEFQALLKQDIEILQMEKDQITDIPESVFGGLTLSAAICLQTPRLTFQIKNYIENSYIQVIDIINGLSNYQIMHKQQILIRLPNLQLHEEKQKQPIKKSHREESQSASQASSHISLRSQLTSKFAIDKGGKNIENMHSNRVIVDIDGILSSIDIKNVGQIQKQPQKLDNMFDINTYLIQIMTSYRNMNIYDQDQLDFICCILILRIAVSLASGVRPELLFDPESNSSDSFMGFKVGSKLQTNFPFKLIPNGRFLPQIPIKCSSYNQMVSRINPSMEQKSIKSQNHIMDSLTCMPMEILVIGSQDVFNKRSTTNVTVYELLNALLEPLSVLPTIFTLEEMQCLSLLICHNFGIDTVINKKFFSSIISTNLSILIVNTSNHQENIKAKSFGLVQNPLCSINMSSQILFNNRLINSGSKSKVIQNIINVPKMIDDLTRQVKCIYNRNYYNNIPSLKAFDVVKSSKLIGAPQLFQPDYQGVLQYNAEKDQLLFVVATHTLYEQITSLSHIKLPSYQAFTESVKKLHQIFCSNINFFVETYIKTQKFYEYYNDLVKNFNQPVKKLNMQNFSLEYMYNILTQIQTKSEMFLRQNGQLITQQQKANQMALGEAIVMRDYFHSVLQFLNNQKQIFQKQVDSIIIDAVVCVAYMQFYVQNPIKRYKLIDLMQCSEFGDVDISLKHVQQIITADKNEQSIFDPYTFLTLSIFQVNGIKVCYPSLMNPVKSVYTNEIAAHTRNYGPEMFVNNFVEMLAEDTTAFMLARYFKLDWQRGDPFMCSLNITRLYSLMGFSNFVVTPELASPVAYLLATKNLTVFKHTMKTIELHEDEEDIFCNKTIQQFKKFIVFIDMCWKTTQQMQELKFALEQQENPIIILQNFNAPSQNHSFYCIMKKFLMLKCQPATKILTQIRLGSYTVNTKVPIKDVVLIIGTSQSTNFFDSIDMHNQYIIDNVAISLVQIKTLKRQPHWIYESTQQQVVQSIFGQQQSKRSTTELIKLLEVQSTQTYILVNKILDRLLQVTQTQIPENILEKYNLCQTLSDNRKNQRVLYSELFKSFKLIEIANTCHKLIFSNDKIERHNKPLYLKCLNYQLVNGLYFNFIEKIVDSIFFSTVLFKKFSEYHAPSGAIGEADTIREACFTLNQVCKQIQDVYLQELTNNSMRNTDELQHYELNYPITSAISSNVEKYKIQIIKQLLNFFIQRSISLFQPDIQYAIYLEITNIFQVCSGLSVIKSSEDYANMKINQTDIDIIPKIFSDSHQTTLQLTTTQQIYTSFITSPISIDKFSNYYQLKKMSEISTVQTIQPDICQISTKLQFFWLNMQIVARFNRLMNMGLNWFVKNNAAYVYLASVDSVYLSFIRGIYKKINIKLQINSQDPNTRWLADQLYNPKNASKIQSVPPQYVQLDSGTNFTLFAQSQALEPQKMMENMQIFSTTLSDIVEKPMQNSIQILGTNAINNQSGTIGNTQTLQVEQAAQIINDSYAETFSLFTRLPVTIKKEMVSDCVYQIMSVIYNTACQSQKHIQNPEQSKLLVNIIYYDRQISILQLFAYVFRISESIRKHLSKVEFQRTIKFEDLKDHCVVLLTDPLLNGSQSFKELQMIHDVKSSLLDQYINPVFVLVPSCSFGQRITKPLQIGCIQGNNDNLQAYILEQSKFLQSASPSYTYISLPQTPIKAFLHILSIVCSVVTDSQPKYWFSGKMIVSLRGLVVFLIKYTVLLLQETINYNDSNVVKTIGRLITKMQNVTENSLLLKDNSPFMVTMVNDMQILQQYEKDIDIVSKIGVSRNQLAFDQLNLNIQADLSDVLFEFFSYSVQKKRTIDENIKNKLQMEQTDQKVTMEESDDFVGPDLDNSADDETSQSSNVSDTSETSSQSTSRSLFTKTDSKAAQKRRKQWKDISSSSYDELVAYISQQQIELIDSVNTNKLETSISQILSPINRKIQHISIPIPEFFKATKSQQELNCDLFAQPDMICKKQDLMRIGRLNAFVQLNSLLTKLQKLSDGMVADVFDNKFNQFQRNFMRNAFGQRFCEQNVRSFLSSESVHQVATQIYYRQLTGEPKQKVSLHKESLMMPDGLNVYVNSLQALQNPQILTTTNTLSFDEMYRNVFPCESKSQIQIQNIPFLAYETSWSVDATVYGCILGQLLQFMKVMQALRSGSQTYNQRIVITTERPEANARITKRGDIEFITEDDDQSAFYMEIKGMRLYGIQFDPILKTVCDITDDSLCGYNTPVTLYAFAVTLDYQNDDYFDSACSDDMHLVVSEKYVPVPMKIGGPVRPLVLLPNKTKIASEYFRAKNPVFGIKLI